MHDHKHPVERAAKRPKNLVVLIPIPPRQETTEIGTHNDFDTFSLVKQRGAVELLDAQTVRKVRFEAVQDAVHSIIVEHLPRFKAAELLFPI